MINIDKIVQKLKKDTNENYDITYRLKFINKQKIYIIYINSLISDDKVSDFIIRSLDKINNKYQDPIDLYTIIKNDIANFKVKETSNYQKMSTYLNSGFTIILVENEDNYLALETRKNLFRSIDMPKTENSNRGPLDSFIENIEVNLGLIRRRIKDNHLWTDEKEVGKYTKTKVNIIYIDTIVKSSLVKKINKLIDKIDIDGILNSGNLKNLIEQENKAIFPTVLTTERPDTVCEALLLGKVVILVDNSPFAIIIPALLNDFFKAPDDNYGKSLNVTFIRILRYLAFFISLFTPAIYIAITTFNQEMLPTELIINFATQRESVPFPAFFEAIVMIISFQILRESDLRKPSFANSALSIAGALILGEAAVNAGIVSPIMIIVIAITAISALPFTEPELINGLRWYRLLFMIGAAILGIIGVVIIFTLYLSKIVSIKSFGKPYLMPYVPTYFPSLKNSIIKFPIKQMNKRDNFLSNNIVKQKETK